MVGDFFKGREGAANLQSTPCTLSNPTPLSGGLIQHSSPILKCAGLCS